MPTQQHLLPRTDNHHTSPQHPTTLCCFNTSPNNTVVARSGRQISSTAPSHNTHHTKLPKQHQVQYLASLTYQHRSATQHAHMLRNICTRSSSLVSRVLSRHSSSPSGLVSGVLQQLQMPCLCAQQAQASLHGLTCFLVSSAVACPQQQQQHHQLCKLAVRQIACSAAAAASLTVTPQASAGTNNMVRAAGLCSSHQRVCERRTPIRSPHLACTAVRACAFICIAVAAAAGLCSTVSQLIQLTRQQPACPAAAGQEGGELTHTAVAVGVARLRPDRFTPHCPLCKHKPPTHPQVLKASAMPLCCVPQEFDSLELTQEKINAITDQIPQKPVTLVEGTSYMAVIIAAFTVGACASGGSHTHTRLCALTHQLRWCGLVHTACPAAAARQCSESVGAASLSCTPAPVAAAAITL